MTDTAHDKPTTRKVMNILKEAGEQGILGPDIARRFTIKDPNFTVQTKGIKNVTQANLQRRLTWTNQILLRMKKHGYAERMGQEKSPHYNNVPAWRWRITEAGVQYIALGLAEGLRALRNAEREHRIEERRARRKRGDDMITQAYVTYDPRATYKCERTKAIMELRAAGCTLDAIGGVFSLTRERVRQIIRGYKVGPCKCPRCTSSQWIAVAEETG